MQLITEIHEKIQRGKSRMTEIQPKCEELKNQEPDGMRMERIWGYEEEMKVIDIQEKILNWGLTKPTRQEVEDKRRVEKKMVSCLEAFAHPLHDKEILSDEKYDDLQGCIDKLAISEGNIRILTWLLSNSDQKIIE